MALIQSNEALQVGVRQFDQEHCQLIEIINQFHSAVKTGKGIAAVGPTLQKLTDFAQEHFDNEENLLVLHDYPELEQHRAAHREIIMHLQSMGSNFVQSSTTLQYETLQFLLDWLLNHTRDVDKKYGPFLNGKGVL